MARSLVKMVEEGMLGIERSAVWATEIQPVEIRVTQVQPVTVWAVIVRAVTVRAMATAPTITPDRTAAQPKTYPNYKIIVLNDDFNTFQYVSECLMKYVPGMTGDRAWDLTNQIHFEGQAIVWVGPQEQAELYHQQLSRAGLTMAPLEAS